MLEEEKIESCDLFIFISLYFPSMYCFSFAHIYLSVSQCVYSFQRKKFCCLLLELNTEIIWLSN